MLAASDTDTPPTPSIRTVLGRPQVLRTFVPYMLAHVPVAAIGVLFVLRVAPVHGYAAAGVVDAIFAVTLAIAGALWGRRMQHRAIGRVTLPLAVVNAAVIAGCGLIPGDSPLAFFILLALINGLSQPPFGGAMRALWDQLLSDEQERHVGYAMEGTFGEVIYTVSPGLLVGVVAGVAGPSTALLAAATLAATAGLAFALAPAAWRAPTTDAEDRSRGVLGALRYRGVRTVVALCIMIGLSIGPVELSIAAYGRAHGGSATVGMLFAVWSVGGILAGFAVARAGATDALVRRMLLVGGWLAAWSAAAPFAAGEPALLGLALFLSGAAITPIFITINGSFGRLAPAGAEAEIYNLTAAGVLAGTMLGAPLTGAIIDHSGAAAGFGVACLGGAGFLALLAIRRHDFAQRA